TNVSAGPNGFYDYSYYGYLYRVYQDPYQYGGISWDLGVFLDDTVNIGERLTLNLGVRVDHNTGGVPDYERLTVGEPSIATALNAVGSGETIPGEPDLINWNLISPRLGFAFQPTADGRSVIKGFFGVFYDQNVIGNWDAPAPGIPPYEIYTFDPVTGRGDLVFATTSEDVAFHPDLRPPRSLQYTAGYDQQIGDNVSLGVQYVYKTTKDLIGWEILDGVYENVPFTDPFTGTQYNLLNEIGKPTLRKGNAPGNFPGAPEGYEQDYHGVSFSLGKRFANNWSLMGSYTWSKSEGLIPRPWFQSQNNPFYGSTQGQDPNAYLNARGRLQGDRPHMFRLQGVFRLPGDFMFSTSVNIESGKPYNRQIRVFGFNQSTPRVIMAPSGSEDVTGTLRRPTQKNVDIVFGKRVTLGQVTLKLDATVYNLLNDDADLFFNDLRLQSPDDQFIPSSWVLPRRLMLRVGFDF
ncbi:MAG: TonB-dependent receptor domain-containing protein, partial [Acidobacteriota bacterium]